MNMFKTTPATSAEEYIAMIDQPRRSDIQKLHDLIRRVAPAYEPHIMSGMLAYGHYHYRSKSGREGDWMCIALASQKNYISLYLMCVPPNGTTYLAESYKDRLPKANIGKSCVRFKKLVDVDLNVITDLIKQAVAIGPPKS